MKKEISIVVGPDGKSPSAPVHHIFTEGQTLDDVSDDKQYPQKIIIKISRDITLQIAIMLLNDLRYHIKVSKFTFVIYGTLTSGKEYTFSERTGEVDLGISQSYPNKISVVLNKDQAWQFVVLALQDIKDNPLGTIFTHQLLNGQIEEVV